MIKKKFPKLSIDVLRIKDFRLLLLARICTFMAMQAQAVIVGWQIYSITRDPLILGLAGLAEALPALVCAVIAGHIVDQSRPHRVYLLCISVLAVNAIGLMLVAGGYVHPPGIGVVAYIFIGVVISGIARAFAMPASFSLFPQIVPRNLFSAGAAWMSSGFQVGTVTAPAITGLLISSFDIGIAWVVPAALLTSGLMLLACIGGTARLFRNEKKQASARQSIKAGWLYIWQNNIVLSVMALDMFAVLLGGAVALLPVFAVEVLHMQSQGFGLLRAAPAIGSVSVGLLLAIYPLKRLHGRILLATVAGFGFAMIGFGLSSTFSAALVFLALSGAFDNVSMVMRQTILQVMTPSDMRGRVSGINSMFIISSNELGAFESGVTARFLGTVPAIIVGGIGTLGVVIATAWLSPQLWRMKIDMSKTEETRSA